MQGTCFGQMVSCGPNCVDVYINGMNNKCLLWINRWNIGPQVVCCCFCCCCCLSFIGRYLMFCNICILTCQSIFCTVNENYSYKSPKLYLLCISFLNCHLNIQTAQNSFAKNFENLHMLPAVRHDIILTWRYCKIVNLWRVLYRTYI